VRSATNPSTTFGRCDKSEGTVLFTAQTGDRRMPHTPLNNAYE